jgi:hypothetical protein
MLRALDERGAVVFNGAAAPSAGEKPNEPKREPVAV